MTYGGQVPPRRLFGSLYNIIPHGLESGIIIFEFFVVCGRIVDYRGVIKQSVDVCVAGNFIRAFRQLGEIVIFPPNP